jgi:hypothetical protein
VAPLARKNTLQSETLSLLCQKIAGSFDPPGEFRFIIWRKCFGPISILPGLPADSKRLDRPPAAIHRQPVPRARNENSRECCPKATKSRRGRGRRAKTGTPKSTDTSPFPRNLESQSARRFGAEQRAARRRAAGMVAEEAMPTDRHFPPPWSVECCLRREGQHQAKGFAAVLRGH